MACYTFWQDFRAEDHLNHPQLRKNQAPHPWAALVLFLKRTSPDKFTLN
jgi:hypothetical protein